MNNYNNNKVHMISNLYKLNGLWVFDEEYLGLKAELFVPSATEVLDEILSKTNLSNKETPSVIFGEVLPEYDAEFILEEDLGGSYNYSYNGKIFWLCGVTEMYFNPAPKRFFIKFIN